MVDTLGKRLDLVELVSNVKEDFPGVDSVLYNYESLNPHVVHLVRVSMPMSCNECKLLSMLKWGGNRRSLESAQRYLSLFFGYCAREQCAGIS
jgi:hypothetical protein